MHSSYAMIDPYESTYFSDRINRAEKLLHARKQKEIEGFDIIGQAGSGGMGVVYIGREFDEDNNPVLFALKGLNTQTAFSKPSKNSIIREAMQLAALNFENTISMEDVIRSNKWTKDDIYLKMPYCIGGSIKEIIGHGNLHRTAKIAYLLEIAAGIANLHSKNIVHLDIKPENILFHYTNGNWKTVVSDFGISSLIGLEERIQAFTPLYCAPEQLIEDTPEACMDVWSWGVLAWTLITGDHPYKNIFNSPEKYSTASILPKYKKLMLLNFQKIEAKCQEEEIDFINIVRQCLTINKEDRPRMDEVIRRLEPLCSIIINPERMSYVGTNPENAKYIIKNSTVYGYFLDDNPDCGWKAHTPGFASIKIDLGYSKLASEISLLHKSGSLMANYRIVSILMGFFGDINQPDSNINLFLSNIANKHFTIKIRQQTYPGKFYPFNEVGHDLLVMFLHHLIRALIYIVESGAHPKDIAYLVNLIERYISSLTAFGPEAAYLTLQTKIIVGDTPTRQAAINEIQQCTSIWATDYRLWHLLYMAARSLGKSKLAWDALFQTLIHYNDKDTSMLQSILLSLAQTALFARNYALALECCTKLSDENIWKILLYTIIVHTNGTADTTFNGMIKGSILKQIHELGPSLLRMFVEFLWICDDRAMAVQIASDKKRDPTIRLGVFEQDIIFFDLLSKNDEQAFTINEPLANIICPPWPEGR